MDVSGKFSYCLHPGLGAGPAEKRTDATNAERPEHEMKLLVRIMVHIIPSTSNASNIEEKSEVKDCVEADDRACDDER
jgi:hypothetical protein